MADKETKEITKKSRKWLIIAGIFAVIAIVAVICIVALGNTPEKRFRKQMDLGNHYLEEMDYEKAVAAFEAAIKIDPNNADAYVGLAKAYLGLGDAEKANEAFQTALNIDPDIDEVYSDLAEALGHDPADDNDQSDEEEQSQADSESDEGGASDETDGADDQDQDDESRVLINLDDEFDVATYKPLYAKAGVIIVEQNECYGAMNYKGELIAPCKYESFTTISDTGYFSMQVGPQGVIYSSKGEVIDTIEFVTNVMPSDEVYSYYDLNDLKYVFKKYDGTIIYQEENAIESFYGAFVDGKAIGTNSLGEYVIITENGTQKVDNPEFLGYVDTASSQGYYVSFPFDACTSLLLSTTDGKAVGGVYLLRPIIDKNGILNCETSKFKNIEYWSNQDWKILVGKEKEKYDYDKDSYVDPVGWRWYAKGGGKACNFGTKMVIINRGKEILMDMAKLDQAADFPVYDFIGIREERNWLVSTDGKWGYCDHDGNILKLYDDAIEFIDGHAFVIEDGMVYLIDEDFNVIKDVGKGTGLYAEGALFCIEDENNETHYYVCAE